jgi:hypothetical protein
MSLIQSVCRVFVLSSPLMNCFFMIRSGVVLRSTTTTTIGAEYDALPKNAGPIRCAAASKELEYLATAGDDKILHIWDLGKLVQLSARYVHTIFFVQVSGACPLAG